MLSRFFKPKWQHPDPVVRLRAAQTLSGLDPRDLEALRALAADADATVRRAALDRIEDPAELQRLIRAGSAEARSRYIGQLRTVEGQPLEAALPALTELGLLAELACEHSAPEARTRLLAQMDEAGRLHVAIHGQTSQSRQAAVEALSGEDALEQAFDALRQRDKGAAQRARAKLDALRRQDRERQQQREQAEALLARLEHLARAPLDPMFAHQLEHLSRQWQALPAGSLDHDLSERAGRARATATERLAEERAREEAAAEAQRQAEHALAAQCAVLEQLERARDALIDELPGADHTGLQRLRADIAGILNITRGAWEDACEHHAPERSLGARYERLISVLGAASDAMQGLLGALADNPDAADIEWPESLPRPAVLKPPAAPAAAPAQDPAARQQLEQALAALEAALDEGHLQQAGQLLRQAQQLNAADARLRALAARLQEMRDWQQFATTPKREALCEAMEALADTPLEGDAQGERVRQLQDAWRALGSSGSDQSLWQRFKQAGDRAWAPAREHQEQLRALRQHNLEQRRIICEQLELYVRETRDQPVDCRACGNILRTAQQEWRRFHPVERREAGPLQQRFDEVAGALQQRLAAEHGANAQARQALIEQARALLEAEDAFAATEQAKQLQQQWSRLGPAEPGRDRQLWLEFRQHCDQIFEHREQARQQRQSDREARDTQLSALLERARALRDSPDERIDEALAELENLAEQLRELAPASAWRKALQVAETALRDRQQDLPRRARQAAWQELRRRAALCTELERGRLAQEQLEAAWQQGQELPEAWEKRLRARLAAPQPGAQEAGQRARQLVLELEILSGVDSPEEDQPLRMQQQMARLADRFGHARESAEEARERIELEWLTLAGLPETGCEDLQHRMQHALHQFDTGHDQKVSYS